MKPASVIDQELIQLAPPFIDEKKSINPKSTQTSDALRHYSVIISWQQSDGGGGGGRSQFPINLVKEQTGKQTLDYTLEKSFFRSIWPVSLTLTR